MLGIPTITPDGTFRECRLLALEGDVSAAHDALSEILEAMTKMPGHVVRDISRVVDISKRLDNSMLLFRD